MILENKNIVLDITPQGGGYVDFHRKDLPLNPINWESADPTQTPFKGHFLCFDRWGPPSEAEKANGFPHHGEVNLLRWEILEEPHKKEDIVECVMRCRLPMGGLELTRKVGLPQQEPMFFVTEEIKNLNKYGRLYNIVQHVSLAPPFLDVTTLFDNNTEKGFEDKEDGSLDQEEPVIKWPEARHNGKRISFRQFQDAWPRVSSFRFKENEKFGWTTAANPGKNLLLGYLWKTEDYPWLNFWREMENGIPSAFGMEFGTTGLHEPFPIVAKKGKIFGENIYDFIDANETIRKSFAGFLAKIPNDYQGVEKIEADKSSLTIKEKRKKPRNIVIQKNLF